MATLISSTAPPMPLPTDVGTKGWQDTNSTRTSVSSVGVLIGIAVILAAFGFLLLTLITGLARDSLVEAEV